MSETFQTEVPNVCVLLQPYDSGILLRFLGEAIGVPQRNVALISGETGRRKTVRILSPVVRPDPAWRLFGQARAAIRNGLS